MASESRVYIRQSFILSENNLKAIVNEIKNALSDEINKRPILFYAKLKDGRIVVFKDIDSVLSHDNADLSEINSIAITSKCMSSRSRDWEDLSVHDLIFSGEERISIEFSKENIYGHCIEVFISSENDNLVYLLSSRLKSKIQETLYPKLMVYLKGDVGEFIVPIFVFLAVFWMLSNYFHPPAVDSLKLREMYNDGKFKDAIDYMIQLREIEPDSSEKLYFMNMLIAMLTALIIGVVFKLGLNYMFPSNLFLWGGELKNYQRAIIARNITFVGVVLSAVVGLLVNLLSYRIGLS